MDGQDIQDCLTRAFTVLRKKLTRFLEQKRCARTVTVNRWSLRAIVPATAAWWRRSSFFFWFFFVVLRAPSCPFVDIFLSFVD